MVNLKSQDSVWKPESAQILLLVAAWTPTITSFLPVTVTDPLGYQLVIGKLRLI